jgi:secondary thiamine-phosphate synthase enzyme
MQPAASVFPLSGQLLRELEVSTHGRGFTEITDRVQAVVTASGWESGLVTLLLRHTSASLLIQENADPEVRQDLERWLARLIPDGDPLFRHTCEGPDDMPAHVRTALTTVSLSLPFVAGRLALGTWQGIYVWEHRRAPHRRHVMVHVLGGAPSGPPAALNL